MLIKEEKEDEDIFIAYYESSNILMSKYIYSQQKLAIIFAKGQQYVYEGVLPYHYQRFKISDSQGKSLKQYIIPNYKALRAAIILSSENIDLIKAKILEIKQYL